MKNHGDRKKGQKARYLFSIMSGRKSVKSPDKAKYEFMKGVCVELYYSVSSKIYKGQ